MKRATITTLILLALATGVYAFTLPRLNEVQQQRRLAQVAYQGEIPAAVVRALSFEFKGVTANYLMLQLMTFVGEIVGENRDLRPEEWQHLNRQLEKITDIDPRFWDPYLLAESMLAWQAGMVEEANTLLLKAAEHRPWDYRPYYFLGFNSFYFQKNSVQAAPYLRKAAQIPGAPYYLQGLAARFSLYGNDTLAAILFLDDMLQATNDPVTRPYLEKRLLALQLIYELEKKVQLFKQKTGKMPTSFAEMISLGLLDQIPADPYGGKFVIMDNGRVYTTSELVESQKNGH